MTALHLGEGLDLPVNVVTRRTAILGQTDTGKTSTAVVLVEEARAAGAQVVVIDPSGAWWGITSSQDGESAGVDMVVMGGEHGDVPLDEHAGRVVARLVADEGYSLVLDLDRPHFTSWAARQRFVADFLSELYERARSQILVVVDEAHRFAPQAVRDEGGDAARCLGALVDIVALARRRGIGCVLITQRLAKLHKDVLELCEIIIAHRLRGNNDRKAIQGWLDEHGEDVKAILSEIARLPKGVARVSAPTLEIEGVFTIRRKGTFDSSASIDVGEVAIEPKARADVDLAALEALMGEAIERQKADDPKALRARVQALESELAGGRGGRGDRELREAIEDALNGADVPADGDPLVFQVATLQAAWEEMHREAKAWQAFRDELHRSVADVLIDIESFSAAAAVACTGPDGMEGVQSVAAPTRPEAQAPADPGVRSNGTHDGRGRSPGGESDSSYARAATGNGSGVDLPRAAAELAETLAAFPDGLPRERLALLTGRKPRGGSWNTAMKALAEQGIAEDIGDRLVPTEKARALFPDAKPLAGAALVEVWRGKLPVAAREIFDVLVANANTGCSLEALGRATGRAPRGGSWNTAIKVLKTSGLVVEESRGVLRANPDLEG